MPSENNIIIVDHFTRIVKNEESYSIFYNSKTLKCIYLYSVYFSGLIFDTNLLVPHIISYCKIETNNR